MSISWISKTTAILEKSKSFI